MFNILSKEVVTEAVAEVATEVAENGVSLSFTTENISEAALCGVAGMVGIFIVVGIIILSVSILNKAGNGKKKH